MLGAQGTFVPGSWNQTYSKDNWKICSHFHHRYRGCAFKKTLILLNREDKLLLILILYWTWIWLLFVTDHTQLWTLCLCVFVSYLRPSWRHYSNRALMGCCHKILPTSHSCLQKGCLSGRRKFKFWTTCCYTQLCRSSFVTEYCAVWGRILHSWVCKFNCVLFFNLSHF